MSSVPHARANEEMAAVTLWKRAQRAERQIADLFTRCQLLLIYGKNDTEKNINDHMPNLS